MNESQLIPISMLPLNKWQDAIVLRFHYPYLERSCSATVVYFMPKELEEEHHDVLAINECLQKSLEACFGETIATRKTIAFSNEKQDLVAVCDGGRPKIHLTVRMSPDIPVDLYEQYLGKTFYAYDYHLTIHLGYGGKIEDFNKSLLITTSFSLDKEDSIAWGSTVIESL